MNSVSSFCDELGPILRLVGIVVKAIQIGVPIILIVIGMIDFTKAVTAKDEGEIKKAQNALIKKAIAAALVFFVIFFVGLIMKIVGNNDYEKCLDCITDPFSCPIN